MNWIYYLLEANFYLVLFYAFYYLLLRRDTYYQLNRAYLLGSCLLAFVIPVLQLGFLKPLPSVAEPIAQVTFTINPTPAIHGLENNVATSSSLPNYYLLVYMGITAIMAISLVGKIYQLSRLARKGRQTIIKNLRIIEMDEDGSAFSFFSYLFISKKFSSSDTIIQHELVHIRQRHSVDIMYLELIKIICWFNPAVYLIQNSLKELHEYIADGQVASAENNIDDYTNFLIKNAYGLPEPLLTNNFFNKTLLKNRIMMLHQKKSGALARLKFLVTLPLLAGLLCLSTLGFTKDYHVFDLLPAHVSHTLKVSSPRIPVLPASPVQPKKLQLTNEGYHYAKTQPSSATNNAMPANTTDATLVNGKPKLTDNLDTTHPSIQSVTEPLADSTIKKSTFSTAEPAAKNSDTTNNAIFNEFYKQFGMRIKYPADARDNNIQGRVFVVFNVDDKGQIINPQILRGLYDSQNQEIIRVLKTCKPTSAMKPGINYTIPVSFNMVDKTTGKYINSETYVDSKPKPAITSTGFPQKSLSEIVITSFK